MLPTGQPGSSLQLQHALLQMKRVPLQMTTDYKKEAFTSPVMSPPDVPASLRPPFSVALAKSVVGSAVRI